ncbi:MAG TPA: FG-GAP-like repeat-containing protein [Urbifossiella sp.]|jgi:hypothetical protein|nr:FG-GAP-like repeat-containing protein [Urbifossiella sp.]
MPQTPRRFAPERLESRDLPAAHLAAVGSEAGAIGMAQLVDTTTGQPRYSVFPFGTAFTGGVRVAAADVTGDGVPDLIAVPGAGGGPVVKVFDGVTGVELRSVLVFDPDFRGGLYVAAADTNLDGAADIVVGAGEGGGPAVAVLDGATGATAASFFAYDPGFRGGVRVAAGDVDGDGRADVITAAGPGGGPNVRAFRVAGGGPVQIASFFAYDPGFTGGVYLAAADLDQDGFADIVTGAGAGGGPLVRGFRADGTVFAAFAAADPNLRTGVRVGTVDSAAGYSSDIATVVPSAGGDLVGRFTTAGAALDTTGLSGGWVNGTSEAAADAALLWNQVALRAIAAEATPAPAAARVLAMLHAAVFDAVNDIEQQYTPYFTNPAAPAGADPEAAALVAGDVVLSAVFPDRAAAFDTVRDAQLALIPASQAKTDGLTVGADDATTVTTVRGFDGSDAAASFPFTPGAAPGDWQPTPPDNAPFLLPGWGNVQPFAIPSAGSFLPSGPPALTSAEYAAAVNEVEQLGSATSPTRTADQTEAAEFWQAGTGTVTPAGTANLIAEQVVRRQNLDLLDSARTFALLNLATADAGIVAWDAKLTDQTWRPVTAIRNADQDGNPATTADPTWTPLLATPNDPDYVSATSTITAAAAAVLEGLFGADYPFSTYSPNLPGVSRSFAGFQQAATEAGTSGIYSGVTTRFSDQDGLTTGQAVGAYVLANKLQPT